jgi:hypothetical protein
MPRMTLTKSDLQAIRQIIQDEVKELLEPAIDEVLQLTAAGFAAVDQRFALMDRRLIRLEHDMEEVKLTVGRIEMQQRAMAEQLDNHALRLARLEKHTGLT